MKYEPENNYEEVSKPEPEKLISKPDNQNVPKSNKNKRDSSDMGSDIPDKDEKSSKPEPKAAYRFL